jgi:hypothetical protein
MASEVVDKLLREGKYVEQKGMIFRPRAEVGNMESWGSEKIMDRSREVDQEDFESVAAGIEKMLADGTTESLANSSSSGAAEEGRTSVPGGSIVKVSAIHVVLSGAAAVYESQKELLNKKCIALEKANKASERIADAALRVQNKSARFVAAIESCSVLQERAMHLEAQLSFVIKFKKTMEGAGLTEEIGIGLTTAATDVISDMFDEAKIIRTLTVSGQKKTAEQA